MRLHRTRPGSGSSYSEDRSEDRDLTTLPNLYLVTTPVTVVRSSGTIVSATVSLGYDVPRSRIEALLKQAAERAELVEPFVPLSVPLPGRTRVRAREADTFRQIRTSFRPWS